MLPPAAALLLLVGTLGFFVAIFVAESLTAGIGQLGPAASWRALGAALVAAALGTRRLPDALGIALAAGTRARAAAVAPQIRTAGAMVAGRRLLGSLPG